VIGRLKFIQTNFGGNSQKYVVKDMVNLKYISNEDGEVFAVLVAFEHNNLKAYHIPFSHPIPCI